MSILCVGIDLAKIVFAMDGVTKAGTAELRQPQVARAKLHVPARVKVVVASFMQPAAVFLKLPHGSERSSHVRG